MRKLTIGAVIGVSFALGMTAAILRAGKSMLEDLRYNDPFYDDSDEWDDD